MREASAGEGYLSADRGLSLRHLRARRQTPHPSRICRCAPPSPTRGEGRVGATARVNNCERWLWAPAFAGATREGRVGRGGYFAFPSLSKPAMYAHSAFASSSFLIPANTILVPGIFAFGSLM